MLRIAVWSLAMLIAATASQADAADRANSTDGRYAATLMTIGSGDENGSGAQALDLTESRSGRQRRLLTSRFNDDYSLNLANLSNPLFSLDGGYIYVSSTDASPNSSYVHRIDPTTNTVRPVHSGWTLRVIRTGPYRGYLLVQTHRYWNRPSGGSYNPVLVVRPDGHEEFVVPGSQNDDGELAIEPWLARKGWRAW